MINEDKLYVWHPYAAAIDKNQVYSVKKAKRCAYIFRIRRKIG